MSVIPSEDKEILRSLATVYAEIASTPVNGERAAAWTELNDKHPRRPMVWINEIPWDEMDVDDELRPRCVHKDARALEIPLRRTIYQWRHMPADMVVNPVFIFMPVIRDSGFGLAAQGHAIQQDSGANINSRAFEPQIKDEVDIAKIRDPVVVHDVRATETKRWLLENVFGDILPVRQGGVHNKWFAPWDELVQWWGIQEALMDLVLRPELVHQAMERLVNAHLSRLRQWREQNLLVRAPGNYRVGSGGYAYTAELPLPEREPVPAISMDIWGCATAQIFSEVSPEMHAEFALRYEVRWLENFGLNYYGCCEPLHNKIDILRTVPRLRKISVGPKADAAKIAAATDGRYVLSCKPNPAILAGDHWNPGQARRELSLLLDQTRGCAVEIIMKDISTVRGEPRRLWEWAAMAVELTGL